MNVECTQCGTAIPADKINVQHMVAVCPMCDNVFRFTVEDDAPKTKRRKVKQPKRVHVVEDEHGLTISYQRIFSYEDRIVLIIFGFIAVVMISSVFRLLFVGNSKIVALPLGGFGLISLYTVLSLIINTTSIALRDNFLRIRRGPMPFPGDVNKNLTLDEITHVRVVKNEQPKKEGDPTPYYHVFAEMVGGQEVMLFKSMPELYARYIAQHLENHIQYETLSAEYTYTNQVDVDAAQGDMSLPDDVIDRMDDSQSTGQLSC